MEQPTIENILVPSVCPPKQITAQEFNKFVYLYAHEQQQLKQQEEKQRIKEMKERYDHLLAYDGRPSLFSKL